MKWERLYEAAACVVAACVIAGAVTLFVCALWNEIERGLR